MKKLKAISIILLLLLMISQPALAKAINSFAINSGAAYTNNAVVTLNVNVDSDGNRMAFSCDGTTWSAYESIGNTTFDINSDENGCTAATGTRIVYLVVEWTDDTNSGGSHNDTIILDVIKPSVTSFSPSEDVVNGDGANGQEISISITDDTNLSYVSISMDRSGSDIYDNNAGACTIEGTSTTCDFNDFYVDRGGSYIYDFVIYDQAGNNYSDSNNFAFTDSTGPLAPGMPGGYDVNITVFLKWANNSENDFNKYGVYRSKTSGFDSNSTNFVAYSDTNSYIDSGLDENTTYYYVITAFDLTGNESLDSDQNSFTTDFDLESSPTITRTDRDCDSNVWCPYNDPKFSFAVSGAEYSWILATSSSTVPDSCTYNSDCNTASTTEFTNASDGTSYFRVKSCKQNGCSPTSTFILKIDTTIPSHVNSLSATRVGYDVNLEWSASTDEGGSDMNAYFIYRSTSSSFLGAPSKLIGVVDDSNLTYTDYTPEKGLTYYYKVRAADLAGNLSRDANSNIVSVGIPEGDEVTATITTQNSSGEETNYYNGEATITINVSFTGDVNNFYLYRTNGSGSKETLISDSDNISSVTHEITTSADYAQVKLEISALSNTGTIQETHHIYLDQTAPSISFKNIKNEATLTSSKEIEVNASDENGIMKVELFLNDENIGFAEASGDVWNFNFDTGQHKSGGTLKATAYDKADNNASVSIKINVNLSQSEEEYNNAVNAINTAKENKKIIEQAILAKELIMTDERSAKKAEADSLLQEAESLLNSDNKTAKEKAELANQKYGEILSSAGLTGWTPGSGVGTVDLFSGDYTLFILIIIVSGTVLAVLAILFLRERKLGVEPYQIQLPQKEKAAGEKPKKTEGQPAPGTEAQQATGSEQGSPLGGQQPEKKPQEESGPPPETQEGVIQPKIEESEFP